jgi:pimeloyl-ACP methyl ester carboxylesterase
MRPYVLLAVAILFVVLCIGFRLLVPTDPGTTQLDQVSGSNSLVVLIHGLPGPNSLTALKRTIRNDFPTSDIMTATYTPSTFVHPAFANIDPYRIANILERQIHRADEANNYKEIILVSHSLGAVLLRKTLVWAHGAEEDRQALGAQNKRPWAGKVARFVSLA